MPDIPTDEITSNFHAPQHGPRPLPLFLSLLWRETENNPELREKALQGLRRYQEAPRIEHRRDHTVHATAGKARLLHIQAEEQPASFRREHPVVLIPSLVNSHLILDLSDRMSLARHLCRSGFDTFLVDWGKPEPEEAGLDLAGHIEQRLVPLIRSLNRPVSLTGYCLGGTLALAAAQLTETASVATIAAPWRFDRYCRQEREQISQIWRQARPLCEKLGYVPMEILQNGFWAIDPERTIRKYADFADAEAGSDAERAFLAVEDWANEGAPLTFGAAADLFEKLYGANDTGETRWTIGGQRINPADLRCPTLAIRSLTDRIVPAEAAPPLKQLYDSPLGHVGMIVSSRAPAQIWQPLSDWLSNPHQ